MELTGFHQNRIKSWLNTPYKEAEGKCPFQRESHNYGNDKDMEVCLALFPELKDVLSFYKKTPGCCHSVCPCAVYQTDHVISIAKNAIDTP